jgi:DNA-binding protein H-NS
MRAVNYDKMSLKELLDHQVKIERAIAAAKAKERSKLQQEIAALAAKRGFSLEEVTGIQKRGRGRPPKNGAKSKSVGIARYANPENRSDTWTGRGRKPNWVLERLKKGSKLADFAI